MTPSAEDQLAGFVLGPAPDGAPEDIKRIARLCVMTALSCAVAGAAEPGVAEVREYLATQGGHGEAGTFLYGDRLPAAQAAMINAVLCRALDYCDAMAPGLHIGSSLIPAALATAELVGGCTGKELLDAVLVGAEVGARLNLDGSQYDGFDPTGVAGVFAATAACARLLRLSADQTRHALGLAFNRSGGSFQSNVDGSLAVRLIQGWVAESAVTCARLAKAGLTGPEHFLTGVYGYLHLFGRDRSTPEDVLGDLGEQWRLDRMVFKRFPSCGGTQAVTKLALDLVAERPVTAGDLELVRVEVPPYTHRLVGHPFRVGTDPRVDAQFSARWCVASALLRGRSCLADFRPEAVQDPEILRLAARVDAVAVDELGTAGQPIARLEVRLRDGGRYDSAIDIPPGFPGNGLTDDEHAQRIADCLDYAPFPLSPERAQELRDAVDHLDELADARELVHLLLTPVAHPA